MAEARDSAEVVVAFVIRMSMYLVRFEPARGYVSVYELNASIEFYVKQG